MKFLLNIFLLVVTFSSYSQAIHQTPEHPKGNTATQMEALPFYNEACELFTIGKIEAAKHSLQEAINISFDLTEAQLFLGLIMEEQNKLDSALYFFRNGIDFSIDQKEHFYFKTFETGMINGEYDIVKHNAGHFKKLYGKHQDTSRYESEYKFTILDFELVEKHLLFVYDYNSWLPKMNIIDTLEKLESKNQDISACAKGSNLTLIGNGKISNFKSTKNFKKKKKIGNFIKNAESTFLSSNGKLAFYSLSENGNTDIFYSVMEGKKWSAPLKISGDLNTSFWESDPWFSEKDSTLYFSSNRTGNKDLYATKINFDSNKSEKTFSLYRINTHRDEINPAFYNDVFYFSSNGHPGFGGFDIYHSVSYRNEDDFVIPLDFYNMKSTCNTNKDETEYIRLEKGKQIIYRSWYKGESNWILMQDNSKSEKIDYELKMKFRNTND